MAAQSAHPLVAASGMGPEGKQGQESPGKELCLLGPGVLAATFPPWEGLPEAGAHTENRAPDAKRPGLGDVAEPRGHLCLWVFQS